VSDTTADSETNPDGSQHHVQKNAARGAWRAFSRVAKRPFLGLYLVKLRTAPISQMVDPAFLGRLRWAWANPNSADVEYLTAVATAAAAAKGPILECGSGLSTVVVGAIAQRTGQPVITLEHSVWWSRNVRWSLKVAQATKVDYQIKALRSYDNDRYEWYDPANVPDGIALVICDGPPATSKGGRYGLMPVLANRLAPTARIFLDDYDRPSEALVVSRWSKEFGWSLENEYPSGKGKFASLTKTDG
jgi:hypothetical protein